MTYEGLLICILVRLSLMAGTENEDHYYQIVPYRPDYSNMVLPIFYQENRTFSYAGKEWTIKQQWDEIGVAAVVWESAILLCEYLCRLGPTGLNGARVVELGTGTGLVGFVASSLGASSVVLTDKDIRPATFNLNQNRHHLKESNISISEFTWGEDATSLQPPFQVILAADVIYIEDVFSDLIRSLADLSDVNSVIYLACKRRYERHDRFFEQLASTGKFVDEVVWTWSDKEEVKVHRLTRKH